MLGTKYLAGTTSVRKCLCCVTVSEGLSPCGEEGLAEFPGAGMCAVEWQALGLGSGFKGLPLATLFSSPVALPKSPQVQCAALLPHSSLLSHTSPSCLSPGPPRWTDGAPLLLKSTSSSINLTPSQLPSRKYWPFSGRLSPVPPRFRNLTLLSQTLHLTETLRPVVQSH